MTVVVPPRLALRGERGGDVADARDLLAVDEDIGAAAAASAYDKSAPEQRFHTEITPYQKKQYSKLKPA